MDVRAMDVLSMSLLICLLSRDVLSFPVVSGGARAQHIETVCVFQGRRQLLLYPGARHGRQGSASDPAGTRAQGPREADAK